MMETVKRLKELKQEPPGPDTGQKRGDLDANANSTITLAEYQAIYMTPFKGRYTNTDGKLVEGEIWKVN